MTRNTLTALEEAKARHAYLKSILSKLQELSRSMKYAYDKAGVPLPSLDSVPSDIEALEKQIKQSKLAIYSADQEWELAEAYLNIYNVEAHRFYKFLSGVGLEKPLSNNTPKGLAKLSDIVKSFASDLVHYQNRIDQIYRQEKESGDMVGFGPNREVSGIQQEQTRVKELFDKQSKLLDEANAEWKTVKDFVKEWDLTAAEYQEQIKKYIDSTQNLDIVEE